MRQILIILIINNKFICIQIFPLHWLISYTIFSCSTSTAFGVTVGVGCLLLVLNLLIFSAIYYQRRRQNSSRESASAAQNEQLEIKTLSECSSVRVPVKQPPVPPVRTSSVPPPGTVKKRVQIQEISVWLFVYYLYLKIIVHNAIRTIRTFNGNNLYFTVSTLFNWIRIEEYILLLQNTIP